MNGIPGTESVEVPPVLLPSDRPRRPEGRDGCTATLIAHLPRTETDLLVAAFAALLHRYTGQDPIGFDLARADGPAERLYFEFGADATLEDLVAVVGTEWRPAGEPSTVGVRFATANEDVEPPVRQLSTRELPVRTPSAHDPSAHELSARELQVPELPVREPSARALLAQEPAVHELSAHETLAHEQLVREPSVRELELVFRSGSTAVTCHYNAEIFDAETVRRLLGHYRVLLEDGIRNPDRPVPYLRLLTDDERHRILVDWNGTARDLPSDRCLHEPFEAWAARTPDAVAVVHGERWTYGHVNADANRLARHLRSLGVGPDVRVGVCLDRSPLLLVAVLGVLKSGGCFVPLDPDYPPQRLAGMVEGCSCPLVISRAGLTGNLPTGAGRLLLLDRETDLPAALRADLPAALPPDLSASRPSNLGAEFPSDLSASRPPDLGAGPPDDDLEPVATPDDLCYIIHTSGSTGEPKPIALRHRGVMNNIADLNDRFDVGPGDALLALSSPSFDMSVYEFLGMTAAGGTVVIPQAGRVGDPAHWVDLITTEGVTVWNSAPALLGLLVDQLEQSGAAELGTVRLALLGGDWVPVPLPDRARRFMPELRFVVMGGATEASIHSTIYEVEATDPGWKSIPYGRPMANQRAYILDRAMQPVPPGVTGELYLAGVGLARSYLDQPERTAERFLHWTHGEVIGERVYRTGDLARFGPDGLIELLGRADFQVKINGLRVEPGEIEAVLRSHPLVREVAVVPWEGRLVAYVASDPPGAEPQVLRGLAASRLPEYMVPGVVVPLDRLPLTPNGKLDRRGLPAPPASVAAYRAPRSDTERALADIYAEVLGLTAVGVNDDFLVIGGDSVRAIQVMTRARSRGIALTPRQVLELRTIGALAQAAGEPTRNPATSSASDLARSSTSALATEPAGDLATEPASDPPTESARGLLAEGDGASDGPSARSASTAPEDQRLWRRRYPGLSDVWPLTPMQAGMVFESMLTNPNPNPNPNPGADAYHLQTVYHLSGAVEPRLLRAAGQAVLDRHRTLRVAIVSDVEGILRQVVLDGLELPWREVALDDVPPAEQDQEWQRLLAKDRDERFDLAFPPLVRMTLVTLGEERTRLVLSTHHALLDGWSQQVLAGELLDAYASGGTMPSSEHDFREFLDWLECQDGRRHTQVWSEYLAGLRGPTLLSPADRSRTSTLVIREVMRVPAVEDTARLADACAVLGVTVSTLVHCAWGLLLSTLTGRSDVVFGTTVSGRSAPVDGVDTMVGLLINTVPVRVAWAPDDTVAGLVTGIQARRTALIDHEHHGLAEIHRALDIPALFDTLVVVQSFPAAPATPPDATVRLTGVDSIGSGSYPLTLSVESGRLRLQYSESWCDQSTAETILGGFWTAVRQMALDVHRSVHEVLEVLHDELGGALINAGEHLAAESAEPPDEAPRQPRTPLEEALCQIFAEVLGVETVGIDDDFFTLGGDSLKATRIVGRMQRKLGLAATIRTVFEHGTIAKLSANIGRSAPTKRPALRAPSPQPDTP